MPWNWIHKADSILFDDGNIKRKPAKLNYLYLNDKWLLESVREIHSNKNQITLMLKIKNSRK